MSTLVEGANYSTEPRVSTLPRQEGDEVKVTLVEVVTSRGKVPADLST
jgi:hypothetical protein